SIRTRSRAAPGTSSSTTARRTSTSSRSPASRGISSPPTSRRPRSRSSSTAKRSTPRRCRTAATPVTPRFRVSRRRTPREPRAGCNLSRDRSARSRSPDVGRARLGPAATLSAAIVTALLLTGSAAGAGNAPRVLQLYSVTTAEQFLNHADDRARGYGDNPFGNFKAPTATTKERRGGPFPGDQALFKFDLYPTPKKTKPSGSAV